MKDNKEAYIARAKKTASIQLESTIHNIEVFFKWVEKNSASKENNRMFNYNGKKAFMTMASPESGIIHLQPVNPMDDFGRGKAMRIELKNINGEMSL